MRFHKVKPPLSNFSGIAWTEPKTGLTRRLGKETLELRKADVTDMLNRSSLSTWK